MYRPQFVQIMQIVGIDVFFHLVHTIAFFCLFVGKVILLLRNWKVALFNFVQS